MTESVPAPVAHPSFDELVRQLTLLRSVADSVPVLVSYIDATHRYRYNNRTYGEWFGVAPESMTGCHVRDVEGEEA
jgi:PAS domain-containing protein